MTEKASMLLAGRCDCGCNDDYSFRLAFDPATGELSLEGVRMDVRVLLDAAQLDVAEEHPPRRIFWCRREGSVVHSARCDDEVDALKAERDALQKQCAELQGHVATLMAAHGIAGKPGRA